MKENSTSTICKDSSFLKRFSSPDRTFNANVSLKLKDGSVLVGGTGRKISDPRPYKFMNTVSKYDANGSIVWSREYGANVWFEIGTMVMYEMNDGSIIISGFFDNGIPGTTTDQPVDVTVLKLTAAGDQVWRKTYHSTAQHNVPDNMIYAWSIAESPTGDLLLAGTIFLHGSSLEERLIVWRISNIGDLVWSTALSTSTASIRGSGIFLDNDKLTVIARSNDINSSHIINLISMDYNNGTVLRSAAWNPVGTYPDNFYLSFDKWPKAIKLNNGNFLVYGTVLGQFLLPSKPTPHFSAIEFDASFNFINGYVVYSPFLANAYSSYSKADPSGKLLFTEGINSNTNLIIGMVDNGRMLKQRVRTHTNSGYHWNSGEILDDGSYVVLHSISQPVMTDYFLEFSRMHNADTGSLCLGYDLNELFTAPVNYKSLSFGFSKIEPGVLYETTNDGNYQLNLDFTAPPPCYTISHCDTLKIHGDTSFCNINQDLLFTSYKNPGCGAWVEWILDTSVLQKFSVPNDSSVVLRFKSDFQGWLIARINTSCGVQQDSVFLTVLNNRGPVSLGPDTVICVGNTIRLNAGSGYATYLWSNGSTDSALTITSAGQYHITVSDACGDVYHDTIIVHPSPALPFSLGPDRIKCNNDTLHLQATSGFVNYTWGPSYNINNLPGSSAIVQPGIDTVYFVRAEKSPGCFVYDTIRIKVNHSPSVNLGPDLSFCEGDSSMISVAQPFNTYLWNTGSTLPGITVRTTGSYSVIATTMEGCKSYDTIRVANTWVNPKVNLTGREELCIGSNMDLDAGLYSKYLWNNGFTGRTMNVNDTGKYMVKVWDNNGCSGTGTFHIKMLIPLPSDFLQTDTGLCSYEVLRISPKRDFSSYTWSTGSTSSSITVKRTGYYWLEVKDRNSCVGRDTIQVISKECLEGFFMPNAFTPNGDGTNDIIKPVIGGSIISYRFEIYNRWGQKVFTSSDIHNGWNGMLQGQQQPSQTFTWTCTYQLEGEGLQSKRGTVSLLR